MIKSLIVLLLMFISLILCIVGGLSVNAGGELGFLISIGLLLTCIGCGIEVTADDRKQTLSLNEG